MKRSTLFIGLFLSTCTSFAQMSLKELKNNITSEFATQDGRFALAFKDLQTGRSVLIHANESFHAASTMKTPVLIEAYKQAAEGKLSIDDSLTVHTSFKSIGDGSTYTLDPGNDSETGLYTREGQKVAVRELLYQMIIKSSNLATNLMIEQLDARNVTATMRQLGAKDIQVLRGVEDGKAYEQGLNNTTTAYDLMLIFEKMAKGKTVNKKSSDEMIAILLDQKFNEIIPALLPKEVKVAHKTGSITGVRHDSGIIFLPDGRKYVVVLLSKELQKPDAGIRAMAKVSGLIYQYMTKQY
jgi:beta-lactamase class A